MLNYCNKAENLTTYAYSSKNENAVIITTVSSCLSILGAVGIFWTYYAIPEIRNFVRSLMICLTVADLLTASGYLLSAIRHYSKFEDRLEIPCRLCIIQSFITTYSSLVSFLLTMIIAVYISVTVWVRRPVFGTKTFMIVFNCISWLLPAGIVTAALFENYLGKDVTSSANSQTGTGPWCWIHVNRNWTVNSTDTIQTDTIVWMMMTGKGWEILCYLVTTNLYVLLKLHLFLKYRYHEFQQIEESLRYEDKNYVFVFLVLFAIRVWGTIRFFINISGAHISESKLSEGLENMQAFGDPSQAFFNFCLFCLLDRTVRRRIFSCFKHSEIVPERLLNNQHGAESSPTYGSVTNSRPKHNAGVIAKPPNSSLNQAGVTRFRNNTDDKRPSHSRGIGHQNPGPSNPEFVTPTDDNETFLVRGFGALSNTSRASSRSSYYSPRADSDENSPGSGESLLSKRSMYSLNSISGSPITKISAKKPYHTV